MSESRNHRIEVISKTLQIIETLRDSPDGLTLQALAGQTRQVKSSVHRILRTLAGHGYIEQSHRGGVYRLGVQFLAVAGGVRAGLNMVELVRPFSRELKETFDESTYIAVLHGGQAVFVDVQETHRDLRLVGPLGARVHFHATAAGKAMAAFFPQSEQQKLLGEMPQNAITGNTVIDPERVLETWRQVREAGYAINDEETIVGAVFIASPVFDSRGIVCGSISIGIPKPRYTDAVRLAVAAETRACCAKASRAVLSARYIHANAFEELALGHNA